MPRAFELLAPWFWGMLPMVQSNNHACFITQSLWPIVFQHLFLSYLFSRWFSIHFINTKIKKPMFQKRSGQKPFTEKQQQQQQQQPPPPPPLSSPQPQRQQEKQLHLSSPIPKKPNARRWAQFKLFCSLRFS